MRKRTGERTAILQGLQDTDIRAVIKLPGTDGGHLYVPSDYWNGFIESDFNKDRSPKLGLQSGRTLKVRLGALQSLYKAAAQFFADLELAQAPDDVVVPMELRPWFYGLDGSSEVSSVAPTFDARVASLRSHLLRSTETRLPLLVYEPALRTFEDYCLRTFVEKRKNSPRPTDDALWYEIIKLLHIQSFRTSQSVLINELNTWADLVYKDKEGDRPDIKTIVERLWGENDLEYIYRSKPK